MSCCHGEELLSISNALALMSKNTRSSVRVINEMLKQSLGSILAKDIVAPLSVPQFDNSAVDGYAVNADFNNYPNQFDVVGTVLAGQTFNGKLQRNQCVRIMTGASVPEGTNCVVMQEHTNCENNIASFQDELIEHSHIRFAGEDIRQGDTVLTKGTRIGPAQLGVISSLGFAYVSVYSKIKVAIFSTGDELQPVGLPNKQGKIYESNRAVCTSKLKQLGCEIIDLGIIKDSPDALIEAFDNAAEQADVIITSGGVSVGEADFVKDVLSLHGKIEFSKVAIKPGKPFSFGHYRDTVFFGLPGNPVAAYVTFDVLVNPTLREMAGLTRQAQTCFNAISQSHITKRIGRTEYLRGTLSYENGEANVTVSNKQGSHIMTSLTNTNVYVVLAPDTTRIAIGDRVKVLPFNPNL